MIIRRGKHDRSDPLSGLRHRAAILASIIVFTALVLNSFFGDRGLLPLMARRQRLETLRHDVEALKIENSRLIREIGALRSDPRAIEMIAREELGLAKQGETVFLIPEAARDEMTP